MLKKMHEVKEKCIENFKDYVNKLQTTLRKPFLMAHLENEKDCTPMNDSRISHYLGEDAQEWFQQVHPKNVEKNLIQWMNESKKEVMKAANLPECFGDMPESSFGTDTLQCQCRTFPIITKTLKHKIV